MSAECDFRVTLLGTGVPTPCPDRFGPSTLIEAGGQKLLIDAGRGATIRLYQLGVPIGRIDALLLTHYHSDHTVGIRLRLRAALWRQWKTPRRRRAALIALRVSGELRNTAGSGRGPWHIARSKALSVGLSNTYFKSLGLPSLVEAR
jgi:phosphoribosyl 1,2-cyclic phosphodiesterase